MNLLVSCTGNCKTDNDCPADSFCGADKNCYSPTPNLINENDCGEGKILKDGKCYNTCYGDSDCSPEEECEIDRMICIEKSDECQGFYDIRTGECILD